MVTSCSSIARVAATCHCLWVIGRVIEHVNVTASVYGVRCSPLLIIPVIDPSVKMVSRKLILRHGNAEFEIDYDSEHGLEVLKFQIFSLTSVPPHEQKIHGGDDKLIRDDHDLDQVADTLQLLRVEADEAHLSASSLELTKSDEELARMLQAEEEVLFYQQFRVHEVAGEFEQRIHPYVKQVQLYEDPIRQQAARKTVPVDELEEKALVSLAKEGNFEPSKFEKDHAFLLQLLVWFKQSFRWVNSPSCECGGGTSNIGMSMPLSSEVQFRASRVELYRCDSCSRTTRFARYNDPLKLIETRCGRCGEWANCFTLYCRAFGYESRLILEFGDHVWTECFSHFLGRWMHLDPCEGIYDQPLLYEKGWNKKLSYVIAVSKDGAHDVTKRYTRKWHEVLSRRNIVTESAAFSVLSNIRKECRASFSSQAISMFEDIDTNEVAELQQDHLQENASISLPGRHSGNVEWRLARSELGSESLCSSSCPLRVCVDDHVRVIYDGFSFMLSQLVYVGFTKVEILETLEMFKKLLTDFRKGPFRMRRSSISSNSLSLRFPVDQVLPILDRLLVAIFLKRELDADGRIDISLAGDPVKTSLALPVALSAIENFFEILKKYDVSEENLSRPLLKFNRITSGSVLASGEELPNGIATSAFDGTRFSKWEEPSGAKGCWIIYKIMDGRSYNVEAYELTSANDAPERDPRDWILEGSEDGGITWVLLDKQSSQFFEKRFEQRTYMVEREAQKFNVLRFRFLAARESCINSRFQIGCIDLFARVS